MKPAFGLLLSLISTAAGAETLSGAAIVVDGETLEVDGKRVRLFGIDAPEASQACDRDGESWGCGRAPTDQLRTLIGANELTCSGHENDVCGRLLAV